MWAGAGVAFKLHWVISLIHSPSLRLSGSVTSLHGFLGSFRTFSHQSFASVSAVNMSCRRLLLLSFWGRPLHGFLGFVSLYSHHAFIWGCSQMHSSAHMNYWFGEIKDAGLVAAWGLNTGGLGWWEGMILPFTSPSNYQWEKNYERERERQRERTIPNPGCSVDEQVQFGNSG